MKMVFTKENDECKVSLQNSSGDDFNFSYIELINMLYNERELEKTEFGDGFSDEEKDSINSLVVDINRKVAEQLSIYDNEDLEL